MIHALRFGPWIVIALLIGAVLWYRADLTKAESDNKLLGVKLSAANEANKEAKATIEGFRNQRIDNDAIAEAISKRLEANRALFDRNSVALKEARNDPQVRPWADTPIPDSVRRAITAPNDIRQPPR